jgi:hypothetical protein
LSFESALHSHLEQSRILNGGLKLRARAQLIAVLILINHVGIIASLALICSLNGLLLNLVQDLSLIDATIEFALFISLVLIIFQLLLVPIVRLIVLTRLLSLDIKIPLDSGWLTLCLLFAAGVVLGLLEAFATWLGFDLLLFFLL